ncbi:MAG: class I SAM-dependent RNA methyltransferase [Clostridiales bacterium]|nr:class I SAM-dependent RNA methyltransferase [Clostridiales bacterium]
MKKGEIFEGLVERVGFPNKGMIRVREGRVMVKGVLPGQRVKIVISKKKGSRVEGRLLDVTEKSPLELTEAYCPHFGACGGCAYQTLPYEEQLKLKAAQVEELLRPVVTKENRKNVSWDDIFEGILPSPRQFEYRNKMEFTFGDEIKDGPLTLGLHKWGSMYDIIPVEQCRIVDEDFRKILTVTMEYFRETGAPFYHRMRHEGYLRHLLVRKATKTGEILVDLVTTTQISWLSNKISESGTNCKENLRNSADAACSSDDVIEKNGSNENIKPENRNTLEYKLTAGWLDALLSLELEGVLTGILHTKNDSLSDTVKDEGTEILYGRDYFYEELLNLRFSITPFSFFQTNSLGAEVLYDTARRFIRDSLAEAGESLDGRTVFDLYSGTGTIAQILSTVAGKVIGVEIVEEAVEAARENAALNGLTNCEFIAGDVLKVLDEIEERPDFIILDPPRDGVHPGALKKIIAYGVEHMIYISCKPTSLARDLAVMQEAGYRAEHICCIDMFPGTANVETVCQLILHKTL